MKIHRSETVIILLLAAVQFVNILDFMMVMPMGPDFAKALDISVSHLGWIGGSYTLSACLSGIICSFFLDKFDRKKALFVAMIGLGIGTVLGASSTGLYSLLMARILAGAFGGPASSLTLSIVADIIPPERRGRALGTVMVSFALASIFGVPAGLELARLGGWFMPFYVVGIIGFSIAFLILWALPSMTAHLKDKQKHEVKFKTEFNQKKYWLAWTLMGSSILGTFMVVPNLSAYLQFNLLWPREHMGMLYLVGGFITLFSTKLGGYWADRSGPFPPVLLGTALLFIVIFGGLIYYHPALPILAIFCTFMVGNNLRYVAMNTLISKVPPPQYRARFMSMLSAVQHLLSSSGSFLSAAVLSSDASGKLIGMATIGWMFFALSLIAPLLIMQLERIVRTASIKKELYTVEA